MVVRTNSSANFGIGYLRKNTAEISKSLAKLSSGYAINTAADNASGLAISQKMKAMIAQLDTGTSNLTDGLSLAQVADSALSSQQECVQRIQELALKATNGTYEDSDRSALQDEVEQLKAEVDTIARTTSFNNIHMLDEGHDTSPVFSGNPIPGQTYVNDLSNFYVTDISKFNQADNNPAFYFTCSTCDPDLEIFFDMNAATDTITQSASKNTIVIGAQNITNISQLAQSVTDALSAGKAAGVEPLHHFNMGNPGAASFSFTYTGGSGGTYIDDRLVEPRNKVDIHGGNGSTIDMFFRPTTAGLVFRPAPSTFDVSSMSKAMVTLENLKYSMNYISKEQSRIGAYENRIEHSISANQSVSEQLNVSNSRITDLDMAKEMSEFTKKNVLSQSISSMLAQSKMNSQSVLQLLQ